MTKIRTAEFVISNSNYKKCPIPTIPEYAFIGRSNVGKSSLINAIVNQRKLAKTSSSPGKTQLINHFIINKKWYLVDLPGFGYAKVSKSERLKFHKMTNDYMENRTNLICLFLLIDPRHKPQKNDQELMRWLAKKNIPFVIIFTKCDKLRKNSLRENIKLYKKEMMKEWETLPLILETSAKNKEGIKDIIHFIEGLNPDFIATI